MESDRNSALRRYSAACLAASLVTTAIVFLMTQLILPVGGDPVVRQMLLQLESRRSSLPKAESGIRVFQLPPKPELRETPDTPADQSARPKRPEKPEYNDDPVAATPDRIIDWWAQARTVIQDRGDAEFEEWLESLGYKKYMSIMQGPMPGSGNPTKPSRQGRLGLDYKNVFGDLVVPINENCVMQMRPRSFDSSDFARNIPPLIVCRSTPGIDLSGLEEYLDKSTER
ncbi:MAG: hypothetical protein AAGF72_00935 [Pseudomonadota bacterium]